VRVFVTVGTQLPFDRLIAAVDGWAARHSAEVFAQTGRSAFRAKHIACREFIAAAEADERIRTADLVVAHAGMGTILARLETGLPMIVMPRRAALGEHRNDHQAATANRLAHLRGLDVVEDGTALCERMRDIEARAAAPGIARTASPALIAAVREFIAA
jgi:UDP-N-acetylglucosamine transferase subunit ALG13